MLRKAVDKSSVVPQTKPRFEDKSDDAVDPSTVEGGWVLDGQLVVARRFDLSQDKRRPS